MVLKGVNWVHNERPFDLFLSLCTQLNPFKTIGPDFVLCTQLTPF